MFTTTESVMDLAVALAKAQQEYQPIEKDKTAKAGQFSYTYADYATVLEAIRPALNKNGLSIIQGVMAEGPKVTVTTRLMHSSGQWMESSLTTVAESAAPQKLGSAITYARRYSFLAMVGAAPQDEDDDGQAAMPTQARGAAQRAVETATRLAAASAPPDVPDLEPFPVDSASEAGDAMRKAMGKMKTIVGSRSNAPATSRKAAVMEYMTGRYGAQSLRVALARVLGRTFPDDDEIKISMVELEKLEAFAIAEEAGDMEAKG